MECHSGRYLTCGLKLEKGMKKSRTWVEVWHTLATRIRGGMDLPLDPGLPKNGAPPTSLQMTVYFPERLCRIYRGNSVEYPLGYKVRRMGYHSGSIRILWGGTWIPPHIASGASLIWCVRPANCDGLFRTTL